MNNFTEIPASNASLHKRKPLFGVGVNDALYVVDTKASGKRIICPYYRVWSRMIARCYSPLVHAKQPTYKHCSVCNEWLTFNSFKKWMEKQDWQSKQLDKDILLEGNKTYSPIACVFVDHHTNSLLNDCAATRGSYPQGVYLHKKTNKFRATIRLQGKKRSLGYFDTPGEAESEYKTAKSDEIKRIANLQPDQRVKAALLLRAEKL